MSEQLKLKGRFTVECYDKDGNLKWEEKHENLVVNEGKDLILDGWTPASIYIGLINNSPAPTIAATDTMSSHPGWVETTDYTEANRVLWNPDAAASQSKSNSVAATFSINNTVDIYGAFTTTSNVKGGTAGTLFSAGAFAAVRNALNGDTINVTYTLTAA